MSISKLKRYLIEGATLIAPPIMIFALLSTPMISTAKAASIDDFGVVSFVSSLPNNTNKQKVVNATRNLGVGWAKEEFVYANTINYAPHNIAYAKLRAARLNILGLLSYKAGISHTQWKRFVTKIVYRYPQIQAWEIMNEADNYLSPADYVSYLRDARGIIKAKNRNAKIILSGIGARVESPRFWNGVKAAGGWGDFDAVGLHIYHNTDPWHDSYNNGTLSQEVQHAIAAINRNGGGKKIWVTEFGWDSNKFGAGNQASWLASGLAIVKGFSEVEKIFIFRMYDQGNGLGLLNSRFGEKQAYGSVRSALCQLTGCQISNPKAKAKVLKAVKGTSTPVFVKKGDAIIRIR